MKTIFIIYCVTVAISLLNEYIAKIAVKEMVKKGIKFKANKMPKVIATFKLLVVALLPIFNIIFTFFTLICFNKVMDPFIEN